MITLGALALIVHFFAMWGVHYASIVGIQVVFIITLGTETVFVHSVAVGGEAVPIFAHGVT